MGSREGINVIRTLVLQTCMMITVATMTTVIAAQDRPTPESAPIIDLEDGTIEEVETPPPNDGNGNREESIVDPDNTEVENDTTAAIAVNACPPMISTVCPRNFVFTSFHHNDCIDERGQSCCCINIVFEWDHIAPSP